MTASYKSGLVDGLFTPEHRRRMGEAVWLFGWLVARQTAQKDAVGFVLSGKVTIARRGPVFLRPRCASGLVAMTQSHRVASLFTPSAHIRLLKRDRRVVAIRQEHSIPSDLPSARLYLEDVQEIVTLFETYGVKYGRHKITKPSHVFKVRYDGYNTVCDTIDELEGVGNRTSQTSDFLLAVSFDDYISGLEVDIHKYWTRWKSGMLSDEGEIIVYGKLKAIFEREAISGGPSVVELRYKYGPPKTLPDLSGQAAVVTADSKKPRPPATETKTSVIPPQTEPWYKRLLWQIIGAVVVALVTIVITYIVFGPTGNPP